MSLFGLTVILWACPHICDLLRLSTPEPFRGLIWLCKTAAKCCQTVIRHGQSMWFQDLAKGNSGQEAPTPHPAHHSGTNSCRLLVSGLPWGLTWRSPCLMESNYRDWNKVACSTKSTWASCHQEKRCRRRMVYRQQRGLKSIARMAALPNPDLHPPQLSQLCLKAAVCRGASATAVHQSWWHDFISVGVCCLLQSRNIEQDAKG